MERFKIFLLLFFAVISALLLSLYYYLPLLDPPNTLRHLLVYSLLTAVYLGSSYLVRDLDDRRTLAIIIVFAVIFRAILIPLDPSMSDDIFRYLWDGRLQLNGINPYLYPADHPHLSYLRDWNIFISMNHPHAHTPYPPTAQFFFLLGTALDPSGFIGFKLVLFSAELLSVPIFLKLLSLHSLPKGRILWYLWSPLVLFEVALDGHLDALALPFLGLFLISIRRKELLLSALLWTALCTVKPVTVWWAPVLALAFWGNWRRRILFFLSAGLFLSLLFLPYLGAGPLIFKQLLTYANHWYFNGFFYTLLDPLLPQKLNRLLLTTSIAAISLSAALVRYIPPERRLLIPLAAHLLISPTLYPWYLLWLYPWLLLSPRPWLWWILSAVYFSHSVHVVKLSQQVWVPPVWASALQFLPLFTILIFSVRSRIFHFLQLLSKGVRKCLELFSEKVSELSLYSWRYLLLLERRQLKLPPPKGSKNRKGRKSPSELVVQKLLFRRKEKELQPE